MYRGKGVSNQQILHLLKTWMLMKIKLLWLPFWKAAFFLPASFVLFSCKPPEPVSQKEDTVLLAADLYLHGLWEAEQRLTEEFLAQLEVDTRGQAVKSQAIVERLAQYRNDRSAIYREVDRLNKEIIAFFDPRGVASDKLPPKAPPPPPPIIEDPTKNPGNFVANVKANAPLTLLFAPGGNLNAGVQVFQGGTVINGKADASGQDGVVRFKLETNTLKPGPAVLQLPGIDGNKPVNVGIMIVE